MNRVDACVCACTVGMWRVGLVLRVVSVVVVCWVDSESVCEDVRGSDAHNVKGAALNPHLKPGGKTNVEKPT